MASVIERRRSLHRRIEEGGRHTRLLESQLQQLQPLAAIGAASSMIAHEINNLLTPVGNYAELALNHPEDRELADKALRKTVLSCQRASKVMRSVMAVAHGKTQEKATALLRPLIEEVFTCLARDFSRDNIDVRIDVPADLEVRAVLVQIQQVVMNLVLNAREAMLDRGGTLVIRAEARPEAVSIEVRDTGPGIPASILDRIFEPFFSTKHPNGRAGECSGTGLGLAFCRTVVEAHDGHICVQSEPGQGTVFQIVLPRPGPDGDRPAHPA